LSINYIYADSEGIHQAARVTDG